IGLPTHASGALGAVRGVHGGARRDEVRRDRTGPRPDGLDQAHRAGRRGEEYQRSPGAKQVNRLFDLTDRVALVTGGSRGIGRAISLALAAHGARVAINYASNAEAAEAAVREAGGEGAAIAIQGGVAQPAEGGALVERTIAAFGRLDILINNAGVTGDDLILRMSEGAWDKVIDTNLKGTFNVTKSALRGMVRQRWGRVISVSSVAGIVGNAG